MREISDLCGEQRNRTPNLSVYDLQHFSKEKCEALVLCGRLKPAKVNLLDIDRFGDREYTILEFMRLPRKPRHVTDFELSEEIKHRLAPVLSGNPFDAPGTSPFSSPTAPKPVSSEPPSVAPQVIETSVADAKKKSVNEDTQFSLEAMGIQTEGDLDDIIRRIDKRIAELEAEEATSDSDSGKKD